MDNPIERNEKICPIGLASELACDKWMPIILRDIGLFERRTFNQILKNNLEGISSGSLASKLKRLEHVGLITFVTVSEHKQKKLYYLTESGIDFIPVLFMMANWSAKWHKPSPALSNITHRYYSQPGPGLRGLQSELRSRGHENPTPNSFLQAALET
jgi:DNA-binding HxlR family transcriptional regulator